MNIKEHIEAGHYPTDDKGRALVPARLCGAAPFHSGREMIVPICATDKPGKYCLLGWMPTDARVQSVEMAWDEDGTATEKSSYTKLLGPPPRKVKITRYAIVDSTTGYRFVSSVDSRDEAKLARGDFFVELTGEYDLPW